MQYISIQCCSLILSALYSAGASLCSYMHIGDEIKHAGTMQLVEESARIPD